MLVFPQHLGFIFLKVSLEGNTPTSMKRYEGQNITSLLCIHLLQGTHSHVGMFKLPVFLRDIKGR